ncbi:MAG: hypothetical protein ACFCVK_19855 [Acidimicrobiales bacterium]
MGALVRRGAGPRTSGPYQYGDEVLHFAGGRLLLRGVNGSGKSTAMNMPLRSCSTPTPTASTLPASNGASSARGG